MRFFWLTTLLWVLLASVVNSQYDEIIISDSFSDIPVSVFFRDLEQKHDIHFFYKPEWIKLLTLSHTGEEVSLADFLTQKMSDYGLSVLQINQKDIIITKNYPIISEVQKIYINKSSDNDSTEGPRYMAGDISRGETGEDNNLIIVGDPLKRAPGGIVEISGYIRETKTGEPIIGATIFVNETKSGTITDLYGHYDLEIPAGRYNFTYRYIGMSEINLPVLIQSDGNLDISMEEKLYRLREIIIEGKRSDNVTGSQMGVNTIPIKFIKEIPAVFGEADIIKVATMLPGVQSAGEGTSDFNVRGGSADQNLILIDDAPVFNISHLFGFFSVFNPEIIKEFELYKASIPAEYGGRLSSVLDINTRSGNKLNFSGNGGISPVTAQLLLEGPIIKGKSSFLIGGRSTYSDWILREIEDPDIQNSNASFYDVNARFNWEINPNNTIDLAGYYSNDKFTLSSETSYKYINRNATIHWKYKFSNELYSVNSIAFSQYGYSISSYKADVNGYDMNFDISHKELKTNFTWLPNPEHKINFGFSSIWYTLNPGTYLPKGEESQVQESILEPENGVESALFISDRFNLNPDLSLYGGLRLSSFLFLGPKNVYEYNENLPLATINIRDTITYSAGQIIRGYIGPEFRLSARYVLDPASSVKICYNRTRQYLHMLSNSIVISPTDTWKLSDSHIPPEIADQLSMGYYRNFRKNTIEGSVEIYYKWIQNMIEYKAGAELLLNEHIETDLISGKGKAYGIEFLFRKDQGRFNGWISYSWSRSLIKADSYFPEEKINDGKYFPAIHDKPHDLSVLTNYKFSRRFSVTSNLTYSSGRPITYPAAKFYFRDVPRLYYSLRNEYRIPDYFRWDVSMNIEGNLKSRKILHSSWSVSVYNVTGRKNAYSVYFISENGVINGYKLSIFAQPIYTVTYHFRF
jgi:hypothetical protein